MSVSSNQAAVREVIAEAFNQGNFDVLTHHFEPGYVERQFGLRPTIEGMQQDIQSLRTWFPDLSLTIEDMVEADNKVWVRSTARGTNRGGFMGPPNGKSFEIAVFDVLRFDMGKIVEHWGAPDRFALMAQLGLLPKR
jgi:predicted ester cyclase